MNRAILAASAAILLLGGCSKSSNEAESGAMEPAVDTATKQTARKTVAVRSPIQVDYRVIGTPIVGAPVPIDLEITSALGSKPYTVSYRVSDETALTFPEAQAKQVSVAPGATQKFASQQVRVIPMREGRLFLNVAVDMETETGTFSSVIAVPIQVGAAPRERIEQGTVTTDENGELIRVLPAKDD